MKEDLDFERLIYFIIKKSLNHEVNSKKLN